MSKIVDGSSYKVSPVEEIAVSKDVYFIDAKIHAAPKGVKLLLLTEQYIAVIGKWEPEGYIGWHPLLRVPPSLRGNKS